MLAAALLTAVGSVASAETDMVVGVQSALKARHFYFGDVDGNLDEATKGALLRFQFRNGLPGTGEMDAATLEFLNLIPARKATVAVSAPVQSERERVVAKPMPKDEDRVVSEPAIASVNQTLKISANVANSAQRSVPGAVYSERVSSWSSQRRGTMGDDIEVRRAIPVAPSAIAPVPRSIPLSSVDSVSGAEDTRDAMKVEMHFTGQDGHVYTYYKKVQSSAYSSTPFVYPSAISDGNRSGGIANR
jgi:peptidoglycan hydrolase-like protein with peptidoglycan-binding domain